VKRLLISCLVCCAPFLVQAQELPNPDTTKLLDWSWQLQKQQPFSQPYLAEFRRGPYHLFFIASHHGNQESAPTFQLIRQALEQEPISLLIIEGVQASDGVNAASFKKYLKNNPKFPGLQKRKLLGAAAISKAGCSGPKPKSEPGDVG
jgi:hypothetical protein